MPGPVTKLSWDGPGTSSSSRRKAHSWVGFCVLLVGSALLAGCRDEPPGQCRMFRATDLPVRELHDHIFGTTMLNGTPVNMLVDTGSMGTALTSLSAQRLDLNLQPSGYVEGIGGTRGGYRFAAKTFQIGSLHGKRFVLTAIDMDLSDEDNQVDGLLGVDFLSAYDVDLDLPDHRISLFGKVDGCRSAAAYLQGALYTLPMVPPLDTRDNRPMVRVEIGGKSLVALIDSGSDRTTLFRNAARRVGLRLEDLKTDTRLHVHGIGPHARLAIRHVMAPIVVGDLTIQNMPVEIIDQRSGDDADMLLGLDFLKRVHVWFGFSSRTLVMQYPPESSPP